MALALLSISVLGAGCGTGVNREKTEQALELAAREQGYEGRVSFSTGEYKSEASLSAQINAGDATPEEAAEMIDFVNEQFRSDDARGYSGKRLSMSWTVGGTEVWIDEGADIALLRSISELATGSDRVTMVQSKLDNEIIEIDLKPCETAQCINKTINDTGEELDALYAQQARSLATESSELISGSPQMFSVDFSRTANDPDEGLTIMLNGEPETDVAQENGSTRVSDSLHEAAGIIDLTAPYELTTFVDSPSTVKLHRSFSEEIPDKKFEEALSRVMTFACGKVDTVEDNYSEFDVASSPECNE
ncbi:hypothetical protein [Dietzia timorensis]|uniref:hypothetical protein n=1 Tax=Dietzia timorensis TaxID=499555 RepID=UPI00082A2502|nr:hypothetical protein [Dietzia timorensis]